MRPGMNRVHRLLEYQKTLQGFSAVSVKPLMLELTQANRRPIQTNDNR